MNVSVCRGRPSRLLGIALQEAFKHRFDQLLVPGNAPLLEFLHHGWFRGGEILGLTNVPGQIVKLGFTALAGITSL